MVDSALKITRRVRPTLPQASVQSGNEVKSVYPHRFNDFTVTTFSEDVWTISLSTSARIEFAVALCALPKPAWTRTLGGTSGNRLLSRGWCKIFASTRRERLWGDIQMSIINAYKWGTNNCKGSVPSCATMMLCLAGQYPTKSTGCLQVNISTCFAESTAYKLVHLSHFLRRRREWNLVGHCKRLHVVRAMLEIEKYWDTRPQFQPRNPGQ